MNKLQLLASALTITLLGASSVHADTTLTYQNNATPSSAGSGGYVLSSGVYAAGNFIATGAPLNTQFVAGKEFRMVGADGAVGGGGEKSLVGLRDDGTGSDANTIEHGFDAKNALTSLVGTDITPGAVNDPAGAVPGLYTNAIFFGAPFGFHQGVPPASINLDTGASTISVTLDVITAQWGGQYFPMGDAAGGANQCNTDGQGCGITLSGTVSNVATDGSGNTTFDFVLYGEHRVTPYEDTEGGTVDPAGFAGWVAQFELHGSGIDVPVVGNVPPTANAGPDQTVIEGDLITLDGSASSDTDGTITGYNWTQTGGTMTVVLNDATAVKPTFTAPAAPDILTFQLQVTDDSADTDTDTVIITVNANQPPVADAGANQTVAEGKLVTLNGSGSSDPDGTIATYNWTQTSGTASITLNDPSIASPTFTAPAAPDSLGFLLTVTDERGVMSTATTTVDVTAAPGSDVLNANNDAIIMAVGATGGMINVLSNDSGDATLYVSSWDATSMKGGAVSCNNSGDCAYDPPSSTFNGADKFAYTASDNSGSDSATVYITVATVPQDGSVLTFYNRGAADQENRYSLQGGVYSGSNFIPTSAAFDDPFTTNTNGSNSEYRMIQPAGGIGGGGEKSNTGKRDDGTGSDNDIYQWIFDGSNTLSGSNDFIDTDTTPSAAKDSPMTDKGAHTNAIFFGATFGFQLSGGTGQMSLDFATNTLNVTWPQGLTAHWGNRYFPMGDPNPANQCNTDGQGCGITMSGPMSNVVTAGGITTFDFKLFGEYRITPYEDTERNTSTTAGFAGWRAQWEMNGSGVVTAAIVSLESPSADNGNIGPTPGSAADGNSFNDGRVTLEELITAGLPPDDGVSQSCIGSCFAVTVTAMTQPSVKIILPLSSPIPASAVYRKFINGGWRDFDTSTGDSIESANNSGGTCAGLPDAAFTPALTQDNNCVRLIIADGSPNDADGLVNGEVTDPGGVGIAANEGNIVKRPSDSIGSGCSISRGGNEATAWKAGDWIVLLTVITWLGLLRARRTR